MKCMRTLKANAFMLSGSSKSKEDGRTPSALKRASELLPANGRRSPTENQAPFT